MAYLSAFVVRPPLKAVPNALRYLAPAGSSIAKRYKRHHDSFHEGELVDEARLLYDRISSQVRYKYLRMMPKERPYIFGIGVSKTGTTSLNAALNLLGFRSFHLPPIVEIHEGNAIKLKWPWWMSKFNAATDLSVAATFSELDKIFPNARFIYTRRDMGAWLASCEKHFTNDLRKTRVSQGNLWVNELSKAFYGSQIFDLDLFKNAYIRHEAAVTSHFRSRNLLVLDITNNPSWFDLCSFLEAPVPQCPFPHKNRSGSD